MRTDYRNWPIRFRWAWSGVARHYAKELSLWTRIKMGFSRFSPPRCWFKWHGVEMASGLCYWIFHLGPIKVIFGKP